MANNQDKGAHQGGAAKPDVGKTGQQGGHGSGGDMTGKHKGGQQSGQMQDDNMKKDWDATRDPAKQSGDITQGKQAGDKSGAMGGQSARDDQKRTDKDR